MRESGQSWIQIQPQRVSAIRVRPRILLCEPPRRRIIVSRPEIIRPGFCIKILPGIAESVGIQRVWILLHTVGVVGVVQRTRLPIILRYFTRIRSNRSPPGKLTYEQRTPHKYVSSYCRSFEYTRPLTRFHSPVVKV